MTKLAIRQALRSNEYIIKPYFAVRDLINSEKNLCHIVDLYLNAIRDQEFRDFCCIWTGLDIPYPKGWNTSLGTELINKLPLKVKIMAGESILKGWLSDNYNIDFAGKIQKKNDLGFVFNKEQEITGMFLFKEEEVKLTGFLLLNLRGSEEERTISAICLARFFDEFYSKTLYDYGIRYLNTCCWNERNKAVLNRVNKIDKANGRKSQWGHMGLVEKTKIDNKIVNNALYCYDLYKRFPLNKDK